MNDNLLVGDYWEHPKRILLLMKNYMRPNFLLAKFEKFLGHHKFLVSKKFLKCSWKE